jgi:hypothetical protein
MNADAVGRRSLRTAIGNVSEPYVTGKTWPALDQTVLHARFRSHPPAIVTPEGALTRMPASPEELQQLKAAIERHCITIHDAPVRLNSGGLSHYYCDLKGVTLHPLYARAASP